MASDSVRVRHLNGSALGRVSMVGHQRHSAGLPERPLRVLAGYAVVYLMAGEGRFEDAHGTRTYVGAGDLLMMFPGVGHSYGPTAGGLWSEVYVVFDGPVFDLWQRQGLLDPRRPVRHLEPVDTWASAFGEVLGSAGRSGPGPGLVDVCRWQSALAAALTAADAPATGSPDTRWLARATALLDADTRREAPLPRLAAELGMSYDGFRKRFRRLAGVSPGRHRSARAVERACELMAAGGLTDREIAARLGYCDEFDFSHRFRSLTGSSPRQFRTTLPRAAAGSPRPGVPSPVAVPQQ